jgi:NAD(P)H-hydrate epimerase
MRKMTDQYRCTIIGKDARTLVMSHGVREICMITNGNSGMATAGSGDVLTGITAAMLCAVQDMPGCGQKAAECAAFIHARAGSSCMEKLGMRAMLAGDILDETGRVLHEMEI